MGCITQIPVDILIDIVSRLSLKEAAKTRAVSRRWKNLFKFYSGCLDFDALDTIALIYMGKKRDRVESPKYIDWVNQVLASHQAQTVEEFRVSFDLDNTYAGILDSWTCFAAAKRVHRLELDLSPFHSRKTSLDEIYYCFPTDLEWKALTSLVLNSVNVVEEQLLCLLSDCPVLEKLSVSRAPSLYNLRLRSPNNKLKHLGLISCLGLEAIEVVSALNLFSFEYQGCRINMLFKDVPQLSSVSLKWAPNVSCDLCEDLLITKFSQVPFSISQLKTLALDLKLLVAMEFYLFPKTFSQFSNLQQLELQFFALYEQSILFLCSFIHASPSLHKLVLKYTVCWESTELSMNREFWDDMLKFGDTTRQWVEGQKYSCLKEVEFLGWIGLKSDVEFVMHLIEAAGPSLESLTLDTRDPSRVGRWKELPLPRLEQMAKKVKYNLPGHPCEIATKEAARNGARIVETKLSPRTKLVLL